MVEQEDVSRRHLENQLVAAVTTMNWSYAIFWSISQRQPGVLTWNGGFFNGNIETIRLLPDTVDLSGEELDLQRSKELRLLYCFLASGQLNKQVGCRKNTSPLSLDDLGDDEWYYMLSMSYTFQPGQGLPGKCFASNEYVWLCNAESAGSETFHRVMPAKSSNIQSIVCIPFTVGVLELGTVDLVSEDPDFVRRITSMVDIQLPLCSEEESIHCHLGSTRADDTQEHEYREMFENAFHDIVVETTISEARDKVSVELVTCPSTRASPQYNHLANQVTQDLDGMIDNIYQDIVMDDGYVEFPSLGTSCMPSSFTAWNTSQQSTVPPLLAGACSQSGHEENSPNSNAMSERRRREKLSDLLRTLKSFVLPSVDKVDKATILAETISHITGLKQRVQELENIKDQPPLKNGETRWARQPDAEKRKGTEITVDPESIPGEVDVVVVDKMFDIEVRCKWKELVITNVFEAVGGLKLDVVHVQSWTSENFLRLKIKAQYAGSTTATPGMISETLLSVVARC